MTQFGYKHCTRFGTMLKSWMRGLTNPVIVPGL